MAIAFIFIIGFIVGIFATEADLRNQWQNNPKRKKYDTFFFLLPCNNDNDNDDTENKHPSPSNDLS